MRRQIFLDGVMRGDGHGPKGEEIPQTPHSEHLAQNEPEAYADNALGDVAHDAGFPRRRKGQIAHDDFRPDGPCPNPDGGQKHLGEIRGPACGPPD